MTRPTRIALLVAALAALLGVAALGGGSARSALSGRTANSGNSVTTAPDFRPPVSSGAIIARADGNTTDPLRYGDGFRVFAQVTDSGRPPSGVAWVVASTSTLPAGSNSVGLNGGTYTVGGTSYNFASPVVSSPSAWTAGTKAWTLSLADNAGNSATAPGASVQVANQPVFRDATSASTGSATATSITVARPAVLSGDVMIAGVASGSTSGSITPPAGWTLINHMTESGLVTDVFSRTAQGSDPSSYTFQSSADGGMVAGIVAYPDVRLGGPTATASDHGVTGASYTHQTAALTVPYAARLLSVFADTGTDRTRTWSSSDNLRVNVSTGGGVGQQNVSLAMTDTPAMPAGTYSRSATVTPSAPNADMWIGAL